MAKNEQAPEEVKPLYKDEINFSTAQEIVGLTPQYFRKLVIAGRVPSAEKNSQGFWKFSRQQVEEWAANRPTRAAGDGRRMHKVRLSPEEAQELAATLDREVKPAYTPKSSE